MLFLSLHLISAFANQANQDVIAWPLLYLFIVSFLGLLYFLLDDAQRKNNQSIVTSQSQTTANVEVNKVIPNQTVTIYISILSLISQFYKIRQSIDLDKIKIEDLTEILLNSQEWHISQQPLFDPIQDLAGYQPTDDLSFIFEISVDIPKTKSDKMLQISSLAILNIYLKDHASQAKLLAMHFATSELTQKLSPSSN